MGLAGFPPTTWVGTPWPSFFLAAGAAALAIGMFGGPWVSGLLAEALGIRPMFGVTACFCLAMGLLVNHWLTTNLMLDIVRNMLYNCAGITEQQIAYCAKYSSKRRKTMDTSGKAFIEHWDWAADKGVMNRHTAISLKSASSKVLSVVEDWETIDIQDIEVEDILTRFQNLHSKDYKPQTLNVYKRRFRQAVSSFLEYVEAPSSWKPTTRSETSTKPKTDRRQRTTRASGTTAQSSADYQQSPSSLVEYPFPLRENLVVYLHLPPDLKSLEVKRLAAFMTTLTVDFEVEKLDATGE